MTGVISYWTIGLVLLCVLTEVGSQLNFKAAASGVDPKRPVASLAIQPLLWIGILLWAVEVVVWLVVLESAPLAIAYPLMALTYAATPLTAALVLQERLSHKHMIGAGLVAAGALLISLSDLGGAG